MRREIALFMMLILLTLTGCAQTKSRIVLPDGAGINSIEISSEAGTARLDSREEIERLLAELSTAVKTSKQSASDAPDVINRTDIDMFFDDGSSRSYVYRDGDRYYIEQPYTGIYRISESVYQYVLDLVN